MGSRVTEERERLGLKKTDFEHLIGCPHNTLYSYEQNEASLSGLHLQKLAEHGFDMLYIVTGNKTQPMNISTDEQEVIENYRAMNQASRLNISTISNTITYQRINERVKI
ncbi:helix-turn-helix domain-containing protein [Xenorhabdus stockiae]|nr:helix-turn-helix transcriptional regulator [Xenorhabdus stockiae]